LNERAPPSFVFPCETDDTTLRLVKFHHAAIIGVVTISGCAATTTSDLPREALGPALGRDAEQKNANVVFGGPAGAFLGPPGEQGGQGAVPWPEAICVDRYVSGRCARWR
jgi:hypothetical protein